MPGAALRVLVVDDNRDGADALGLLAEELGHQVHVTYGGVTALEVARVFRPDLMLVDLAMPDMDGCSLVQQLCAHPDFAQTKLVAITGHADQGHKTLAMKSGFAAVLFKPVALKEFKATLAGVVPVSARSDRPRSPSEGHLETERHLPIAEARKIKQQRGSRTLTEGESEAAICASFIRFQQEYLGWHSEQIQAHFIKSTLIIRVRGGLTPAERHLAKVSSPTKGRDLIKEIRQQLLELGRSMLESIVYEVAGIKADSMFHDISTVTGEEVVVFGLASVPRFERT